VITKAQYREGRRLAGARRAALTHPFPTPYHRGGGPAVRAQVVVLYVLGVGIEVRGSSVTRLPPHASPSLTSSTMSYSWSHPMYESDTM
jgi:hypothetical protein